MRAAMDDAASRCTASRAGRPPDVEARLASDLAREGPLDEGKAAAVGGVLSGAVTGLAADLAAGGLTFGAGMLTGAMLGALGGAGVARAVNVARGQTDEAVRWDDAFLERLVAQSLLRYLAIAHYGRGRGDCARQRHTRVLARPGRDAPSRRGTPSTRRSSRMRGPDCDAARVDAALPPLLRETTLARCSRSSIRRIIDEAWRMAQRKATRPESGCALSPADHASGADIAVGPGKIDLLEAIARTGSITAAAKAARHVVPARVAAGRHDEPQLQAAGRRRGSWRSARRRHRADTVGR